MSIDELLAGGLPPVCAITGTPTDVYVDYPVGRSGPQSLMMRLAPRTLILLAGIGMRVHVPMTAAKATAYRRANAVSSLAVVVALALGLPATVLRGWPGLVMLLALAGGAVVAGWPSSAGTDIRAVALGRMVHLRKVHPMLTRAWAGMGEVAIPTSEPPLTRVVKLDLGPPAPPVPTGR